MNIANVFVNLMHFALNLTYSCMCLHMKNKSLPNGSALQPLQVFFFIFFPC